MSFFLKIFWKVAHFFYPYIRDFLLFLRIVKHGGRQNFHVGFLDKKLTVENFEENLKRMGFEKDIIAWIDDGELLSMRKLKGRLWQYHLRLFKDGEIRGHEEYSPESWHWWKHFKGVDERSDEKYFKRILSGVLKEKS